MKDTNGTKKEENCLSIFYRIKLSSNTEQKQICIFAFFLEILYCFCRLVYYVIYYLDLFDLLRFRLVFGA